MTATTAALGIGFLLISLACLGTWPALLRLCTVDSVGERASTNTVSICGGKVQIPMQNRHPCHVYIDYALSYVVSSVIPILCAVMISDEEAKGAFFQAPLVLVAMVGGALLSFGNLSFQWATAVFGSPLTTVLAIQASLTVTLGTSINYFLEPRRTAHPKLLAWGVLAFLLAIGLATLAQLLYGTSHAAGQRNRAEYAECGEIVLHRVNDEIVARSTRRDHSEDKTDDAMSQQQHRHHHRPPSPLELETASESSSYDHQSQLVGLYVAFFGGLCFGFFSPAFNIAVNDPFDWNHYKTNNTGGLSVAAANIWFSISFALASIAGNIHLMHHPPTERCAVQRSSVTSYLTHEGFSERRMALLAGFVCAAGNVLQFQGGHLAGFAASDLVQAYPLVATIWDVVLFGEFRSAACRVLLTLTAMYATYISGIVLLASSIAI